jgi:hypothetical protein
MLQNVISVECLSEYRLRLRFEDGVEGIVDVAELVSCTGVFAPLKDRAYFARVRVDSETGTICWPNGAPWTRMSCMQPSPEKPLTSVYQPVSRKRSKHRSHRSRFLAFPLDCRVSRLRWRARSV